MKIFEIISDCLISSHAESKKTGRPLSLKVFVAGRNRLENEGALALAEAFRVYLRYLKSLEFHENSFTYLT